MSTTQASLNATAKDALDKSLPLLDGLYPLNLRADPECDTSEDVAEVLNDLCEEIFDERLAGLVHGSVNLAQNRTFDVFCHWFDSEHHSMLVDLCDEPLIRD